jgi:NADPH2:quinone reductase
MRAVVCREYGPPDRARVEDIPAPPMIANGVRIAVHASCASFASLLVMAGKHQNRADPPFIPGTEVSGVVIECAPGVALFRPGDRVVAGMPSGGYADEAVVPVDTVFHLPQAVDFDSGSQFPTIYATAYGAFKWRAQVQEGETILVHGAGGGSGLAAVEVGKALGARVIATAGSQQKLDAARSHGADEVINYRTENFRERVLSLTSGRGADVIYDPIGGEVFDESLRCIAPEGRIIPMGFAGGTIPQIAANILLVKNITVIGMYWGYYFGWGRQAVPPAVAAKVRAAYAEMFEWVIKGKLRPLTYRTFDLADFKQALHLISSREVIGRVVLRARSPQA